MTGPGAGTETRLARQRQPGAAARQDPRPARPGGHAAGRGRDDVRPPAAHAPGRRPFGLPEPDLVVFQLNSQFRVVEIKSFAVIDGRADGDKVAAADRAEPV